MPKEAHEIKPYLEWCNIFPPNYGFEKVCSCDECIPVISRLKDFAEGLKSKCKKVMDLMILRNHTVDRCASLTCSSQWSVCALDVFLNHLKAVCEEAHVSLTVRENKLKDEDLKLDRMIADSGLLPGYHVAGQDKGSSALANCIYYDIDFRGMSFYDNTKVKDEAHDLLNKVLVIGRQHEDLKQSAANKGETLDPLISKYYIEQQIECLEKLPVGGLRSEVEERISKVSKIIPHEKDVCEAFDLIRRVADIMVATRRKFWQNYRKNNGGRGHDSIGFIDTLGELLSTAGWFEDDWKEYAHLIHFYDQSYPKRQRTQ